MANNLSEFEALYSLAKTMRAGLIPVGKTKYNMETKGLLSEDNHRANNYKKVKRLIDAFHKQFIEKALSNVYLEGIEEYGELYCKNNKTEKDKTELNKASDTLRKQVVKFMTSQEEYKKLDKKEFIEELLVGFVDNEDDKNLLKEFKGFTTYFKGLFENRKNMYSAEEKSTSIAYRVINQNLPRYIDNVNALKKIFEINPDNMIENIESDFKDILEGRKLEEFMSLENYSYFITQSGIDKYNSLIGGVSLEGREKVKGINEYVNLYNQKAEKRIGLLKPLFKQILAERTTKSFLPEAFDNDNEVLNAIELFHSEQEANIRNIKKLLGNLKEYGLDKVYIKSMFLNEISNAMFGEWSYIKFKLEERYDRDYSGKKKINTEKYIEERNKYFKNKASYSISEINEVLDDEIVIDYFNGEKLSQIMAGMIDAYKAIEQLLNTDYPSDRRLQKDSANIELIKNYLDSCKEFGRFIQPLLGEGKEGEKDAAFYGELVPAWENFDGITPLYNKVRNYMTKKPYSIEKIKLTFNVPTFLNGWALNNEKVNKGIILKDERFFYLGIIDKDLRGGIKEYKQAESEDDVMLKMKYLQAADPQNDVQNLMVIDGVTVKKNGRKNGNDENVRLEQAKNKYLPKDINDIRKKRSYSKTSENFSKGDLNKYIDYYKERTIEYWDDYDFEFKETKEYRDFTEFTDHINSQAYQVNFEKVSKKYIYQLVDEGKLYLFKIWNKDFSAYSKGTPNLHTLYWKMLFDERNLKDVVYKLNGKAEVFFRKASIKEKDIITHEANKPIKNKNELNSKSESVFDYDLIKDRRYTVDKFQFHVPITLNFKATGNGKIERVAREYIKEAKDLHIIGIDRGERHLLYLTVIDMEGNIKEQYSLNEIVNEYNGVQHRTNYHNLLDKRENEMLQARKKWQTIENIKELKEGYISQAIHKISQLMIKYNAILVLEDLNSGFINKRKKVEKQVYRKFEKMMINKFNFLVDKTIDPEKEGGLLKAYQLTSEFKGFNKLGKQSGMLFYVPAWNTSKIDPCTGFVNLFEHKHLKYSSVNASMDFWSKFDCVTYDDDKKYFKFNFDYNNFTGRAEGTRTKWTVCSIGERIINFRNPDNNSQWDSKVVDPTKELINLCKKYNVNYMNEDLKPEIITIKDKSFHEELLRLFRLILQMRNSKTGTEIDYMISPVANDDGVFYDSRICSENLPANADANGAYNIAKKGLWLINRIKETENSNLMKAKLAISNKEWLNFAQKNLAK